MRSSSPPALNLLTVLTSLRPTRPPAPAPSPHDDGGFHPFPTMAWMPWDDDNSKGGGTVPPTQYTIFLYTRNCHNFPMLIKLRKTAVFFVWTFLTLFSPCDVRCSSTCDNCASQLFTLLLVLPGGGGWEPFRPFKPIKIPEHSVPCKAHCENACGYSNGMCCDYSASGDCDMTTIDGKCYCGTD
jgi:hypothetical protein